MNDMDNNARERGYLTIPLYERSFGVESAGDFTLPDYQNEIRRILHVSQTVLPPAKYVSDDSVEFNGTVDYQVIYIGGDGGMYSVPLSSDYKFSVPLDKGTDADIIDDVCVLCSVSAESVNTRVSAPRRLSIRSRIRPNVRIYGKIPALTAMESEVDPSTVYRRIKNCTALDGESNTSDIINVTWSSPLPADDIRVVCADASVTVIDKQVNASSVNCRGEVHIKMLCVSEDSGEYSEMEGEIPFEGEIDTENDADNWQCRICGFLAEMAVDVTETGIECNAGVILEALTCKNTQIEYTDDVYSTERECQCSTRKFAPRNVLTCHNASFTVSERIPLSSTTVPENAEVIWGYINANMDKCTLSGNKYIFEGNAATSVIYRKDGEISVSEVNVPLRYEADAQEMGEPVNFDVSAMANGVKIKLTDSNLCVDAEIFVSADCLGDNEITVADRVSFGESVGARESEIIVCYPATDDTLWSVAKRYRVAPTKVMGDPEADRYVMIE